MRPWELMGEHDLRSLVGPMDIGVLWITWTQTELRGGRPGIPFFVISDI